MEGERKIHLVDWNTMTLNKDKGGPGIRGAMDMNMAFMAQGKMENIKKT